MQKKKKEILQKKKMGEVEKSDCVAHERGGLHNRLYPPSL